MILINDKNRKWWTLIAISACLAIVYLDQTGVALTLESIQRTLNLSNLSVQWVVNSYLLTLSVLMLLGGRFADIFGHRRIFLIGMSFFLIASICCATATVGWWLILSRAFQGLGGAFLIPTSLVLVANSVKIEDRGKVIGACISFASAFLAFGPTIGGALTEFWNWRLIFWINIPIGLISILLTLFSVPKEGSKNSKAKMDWPGFITLSISLTCLVTAFMQGALWGWSSPKILLLFATFIVFILLFLRIDLYADSPLINLNLFRNPTFFGGNIILFFLQTCHISSAVFWVLYLQNVLGYSAGKAGLFILPVTLPVMFSAQMSGRLLDRYGPCLPISLGLCMSMIGVLWVAIFANAHHYFLLFPGFLLYGIGAPLAIPAAMTTVISSVTRKDHGMASGMANTMRQIGGALGLSIIGAIITSVNHAQLGRFLSDATGVVHLLQENQLEKFLTTTSYANGSILGLSLQDIFTIHDAVINAYANAFAYGMFVAALFAFFAFVLAVSIFKKSHCIVVDATVKVESIGQSLEKGTIS